MGLLPVTLLKRLPVEETFTVEISPRESFRYVSTRGDQTGRALYWIGKDGIDPETTAYFESHVRTAKIFADVGANVGRYSLYACAVNSGLQVHAFEPVARTFAHMKENIEANGWLGRCSLMNAAVGTLDGQIDMHIPFDDYPLSASLNEGGFNNIKGQLVKTSILRLDTYFRDKTPPDVLKIDVEGFEHQVLEGASGLFAQGLRPVVILECNPGGPGREITDILLPLGYDLFQLRDTGPLACEVVNTPQGDRFHNWAAIAKAA